MCRNTCTIAHIYTKGTRSKVQIERTRRFADEIRGSDAQHWVHVRWTQMRHETQYRYVKGALHVWAVVNTSHYNLQGFYSFSKMTTSDKRTNGSIREDSVSDLRVSGWGVGTVSTITRLIRGVTYEKCAEICVTWIVIHVQITRINPKPKFPSFFHSGNAIRITSD